MTRNKLEALCPATFGREAAGHSWVTVSQSSYRDAPYTMCSKCGQIAPAEALIEAIEKAMNDE